MRGEELQRNHKHIADVRRYVKKAKTVDTATGKLGNYIDDDLLGVWPHDAIWN